MGKAKHSGSAVRPSEHPFRTKNLIPQQLRLTAECLPQELSLAKGIFLAQGDTFSLEAAHIQWLATGGVNKGQVQPTCHNSGHWKPTPAAEIPSDQLMLPLWLYIPIQLYPLPNELPHSLGGVTPKTVPQPISTSEPVSRIPMQVSGPRSHSQAGANPKTPALESMFLALLLMCFYKPASFCISVKSQKQHVPSWGITNIPLDVLGRH